MGAVAAQLDMFLVSTVDPPLRDNRDTMEYPFLSLQKKRTKAIEFSGKGVSIEVQAPAKYGLASIWDWDLIIFAASHLNEAIEAGLKPSPRVRFVPYDCLKQIGRGTSGRHYQELAQSMRRLRMTTIITNIREDDESGEERPFSWLADYSIPKRYSSAAMTPDSHDGEPDPARPWEIELPPWLFNSIMRRREILAVHPDYFQLTGGLERWLYRLARKAVPDKQFPASIKFRMDTLHQRSGTTRPLKQFAFDIRKMAEADPLPEYGVRIERNGKHELVILYRDREKPCRKPRGIKRMEIEGLPRIDRASFGKLGGRRQKQRPPVEDAVTRARKSIEYDAVKRTLVRRVPE
ncbi:MAG: replication initiator protein A [Methylocella sp.]